MSASTEVRRVQSELTLHDCLMAHAVFRGEGGRKEGERKGELAPHGVLPKPTLDHSFACSGDSSSRPLKPAPPSKISLSNILAFTCVSRRKRGQRMCVPCRGNFMLHVNLDFKGPKKAGNQVRMEWLRLTNLGLRSATVFAPRSFMQVMISP